MYVLGLTKLDTCPTVDDSSQTDQHELIETEKRRSCSVCYAELSIKSGRTVAKNKTPKTKLYCNKCSKSYCLPCYFKKHASTSK